MGRVGTLLTTPLQQSQSLHTLQYDIEKNQFQLALNETGAKFAQYCMVESSVGQLQTECVLPVDASTNRVRSLAIGKPFRELQHRGES